MPVYYRRLIKAIEEGMPFISSDELGRSAGVPGAQVRKDLSYLSQQGRPGIGYDAPSGLPFGGISGGQIGIITISLLGA